MPLPVRAFLGQLARALPTVAVLGGLAAVAAWGVKNDWKLPSLASLRGAREGKEGSKPEKELDGLLSPGPVSLSSEEAAAGAGIETAPARRAALRREVAAPAVVAFDQRRYAHIGARAAGSAWRVLKEPGDPVKAGDVLALIVTPELSKIKADFFTAFVQAETRQKALERARAASSLPERQVREAEQALREARAALINSRQALANLGLPLTLATLAGLADDAVNEHLRTLGLTNGVATEKDVPGNLLPIVAPFDGHVIRCDLVVGEAAGPGQPSFVVADTRRLWVMLDVRQEDSARLATGQRVVFEARATGQRAYGNLTWISPEVDPKARTVRARAEVENANGRLRPATFGTAHVELGEARAVTVPDAAMQWDGRSHRVFVRIDGKTFEPRLVLPGLRVDGRTELVDPGAVLGAGLLGLPALGGPLASVNWVAAGAAALQSVRPGEVVATTGSHVLKSEMFRGRIGGDED